MKKSLNQFTIRSLKLNKKRTIATCIGIILSTALICAVAGVFSSFQQTLLERSKTQNGDYHTLFYNISNTNQKYITENRNIDSYFFTQDIGYSKLDGSKNDYKPYLYLMEFDKTALNNFGIILKEGRLPENSNELLIPEHIRDNAEVNYKVGDKITLNIGKRLTEDGYELGQNNPYNNPKDSMEDGYEEEYLKTEETREFTIVGIIERPNMEIEDYTSPGYTVITLLTQKRDNVNILVKFKDIKDTYKLSEEMGIENYHVNEELLRWSGVSRSDNTTTMLYSLAGIVIGIIIVTSVFVIRNSFAISITEKMKQYGMLSSIGATKKQIKSNVLFEGMLLGLISIPIGILVGILATFILIKITTILIGSSAFSTEIEFIFSMPISVVILSIVLGFLTIYLSCIVSARRASKISPIDAIRSEQDIKINPKKIKCPKIINKIFGIGGILTYKNLKRNKKKYRTTVISLVLSITVFISLTSFMYYAFDIAGIYYKEMDYNVLVGNPINDNLIEESKENYEMLNQIANKYKLDKYSIMRYITVECKDLIQKLSEQYKKINEYYIEEVPTINLTSLGKDEYKRYIKKIGEDYDKCKDGIIYCDNTLLLDENNKKVPALNFNENDVISCNDININKDFSLKIISITDEVPMGMDTNTSLGTFVVSDEFIDKIGNYICYLMRIESDDPYKLCEDLEAEYDNIIITNYKEQADEQNRMVLLISIFLYGFITVITLIGVTNIFNTITTNMNLRSKEFAMLKSIGMTKKEFNKMIRLESIFYGCKSLFIGIILGTGISYWIYKVVIGADVTSNLSFIFPTIPIIISIIFISVIVGIIMKYSLNKINKQNIIETIRNENI